MGRLDDLAFGKYILKIAHVDEKTVIMQSSNVELYKVPGKDHFVWSTTPPAAYRRWWGKKSKRDCSIDQVELSSVSGPGLTQLVYLRGWSFKKQLGAPVCSFITWSEPSGTKYCISRPSERPDVAGALRDPRAMLCGFMFFAPPSAIQSGSIRMYQCYARQTIEFVNFNAEIAKAGNR